MSSREDHFRVAGVALGSHFAANGLALLETTGGGLDVADGRGHQPRAEEGSASCGAPIRAPGPRQHRLQPRAPLVGESSLQQQLSRPDRRRSQAQPDLDRVLRGLAPGQGSAQVNVFAREPLQPDLPLRAGSSGAPPPRPPSGNSAHAARAPPPLRRCPVGTPTRIRAPSPT